MVCLRGWWFAHMTLMDKLYHTINEPRDKRAKLLGICISCSLSASSSGWNLRGDTLAGGTCSKKAMIVSSVVSVVCWETSQGFLPSSPFSNLILGASSWSWFKKAFASQKSTKATHTGHLYNPTGIWLLNTGQHTPAQHSWQLGNGALAGKENQKDFPFLSSIGVMGHQALSCLSRELISWKLFPLELTFLLFQNVWFWDA